MECLKNVIGITRKECDCFEETKPEDSNKSLSGLYLDELDGLSMKQIDSSSDCGDGSVWDMMTKAISNAEINVKADLLTMISSKYSDAYSIFSGLIGNSTFNGALSSLKSVQGIIYKPTPIDGGFITVKEIDTYFNQTTTGEINLEIYRTGSEDVLYTIAVDTEANKIKKNIITNPIKLPLYIDGVNDLEYYFIYTKHATAIPLNNKMSCGCSGKVNDWQHWGDFNGININPYVSISELNGITGDLNQYGLGLIVQMGCEKSSIICKSGTTLDFVNDAIAINIAFALRYNAGISLLNGQLTRPDSSLVAINSEQIVYLVGEYTEKYNEILNYLSSKIESSNGCFICDNEMKLNPIYG
mgnify:CR=1 FL=1